KNKKNLFNEKPDSSKSPVKDPIIIKEDEKEDEEEQFSKELRVAYNLICDSKQLYLKKDKENGVDIINPQENDLDSKKNTKDELIQPISLRDEPPFVIDNAFSLSSSFSPN